MPVRATLGYMTATVLLFTLFVPLSALAVGISPAKLELEDLYVGATTTKNFFVSRAYVDNEEFFLISVSGGAKDFVSLSTSSIVMSPGQREQSVSVFIHPRFASTGTPFQAGISFIPVMDEVLDGGNMVGTGVATSISFTATTTPISAISIIQTDILRSSSDESGKIKLRAQIKNAGNVPVRLEKGRILFTSGGNTESYDFTVSKIIDSFRSEYIEEFLDVSSLSPGTYVASANFRFDRDVSAEAPEFTYTVPQKQLTNPVPEKGFINKNFGIFIGGLFVIISLFIVIFTKKKHV